VAREKEAPSPRVQEHHQRLDDAIRQLEEGKATTRLGPSLDDLEKSLQKRRGYVLRNMEKFAAALSG
jgi:hypothetical protein